MSFREQGFFRGRRLSARSQNACHAADGRESSQGAGDDSASEAAEDRSGDGRKRTADEIVEVTDSKSSRQSLRANGSRECAPEDRFRGQIILSAFIIHGGRLP